MPEGFWPDELSVKQVETERLRRDKRNIRNDTIEECAQAVKAQHRLGDSVNVGLALERAEAAIRALKDGENGLPVEARSLGESPTYDGGHG